MIGSLAENTSEEEVEEMMDELVNMLQFNYLQYQAMKDAIEDLTEEEVEEIMKILPEMLQFNYLQY